MHLAPAHSPILQKALPSELLAEHLKTVPQALDPKSKLLTLTLGVNDSMVRHAEMPRMPVDDMRMVLKLNPKTYLQQDLSNHLYDCHVLPAAAHQKDAKAAGSQPKHKVVIAAA